MKKKIAIVSAVTLIMSGCSTFRDGYNKSALTPDGFNYSVAVDQAGMHPSQHYFGLSWSLKDSK